MSNSCEDLESSLKDDQSKWLSISQLLYLSDELWFRRNSPVSFSEPEIVCFTENVTLPPSRLQERVYRYWLFPVGRCMFVLREDHGRRQPSSRNTHPNQRQSALPRVLCGSYCSLVIEHPKGRHFPLRRWSLSLSTFSSTTRRHSSRF